MQARPYEIPLFEPYHAGFYLFPRGPHTPLPAVANSPPVKRRPFLFNCSSLFPSRRVPSDRRDPANPHAQLAATLTASRILETSPGPNAPDWTRYTILELLRRRLNSSALPPRRYRIFSHSLYISWIATLGDKCAQTLLSATALDYIPGITIRSILETNPRSAPHRPVTASSSLLLITSRTPIHLLVAAPLPSKTRRFPHTSFLWQEPDVSVHGLTRRPSRPLTPPLSTTLLSYAQRLDQAATHFRHHSKPHWGLPHSLPNNNSPCLFRQPTLAH